MNRAELKQQYKNETRQMGVFAIRNQVNGKLLIGASLNLPGSINRVRFQLKMGMHENKALQQDWKTHGADCFSFEVLDELAPVKEGERRYAEDVRALESLWLEKLKPYGEAGYNTPPKPAQPRRAGAELD